MHVGYLPRVQIGETKPEVMTPSRVGVRVTPGRGRLAVGCVSLTSRLCHPATLSSPVRSDRASLAHPWPFAVVPTCSNSASALRMPSSLLASVRIGRICEQGVLARVPSFPRPSSSCCTC